MRQATLALSGGFDGVTVSEHHAGWPGYYPVPSQLVDWILSSTGTGWAAALPVLLTLQPTEGVAERLAWQAAHFPGRVGVGFAAGYDASDFRVFGADHEARGKEFRSCLERFEELRSPASRHPLRADPAVEQHLAAVPVILATSSDWGVRFAATAGHGILLPPLPLDDHSRLVELFRSGGGHGPNVLMLWAWLGHRERNVWWEARTGGDASTSQVPAIKGLAFEHPDDLALAIVSAMRERQATAVSLRVHTPGASPAEIDEQILRLAETVLPHLRQRSC